MAKKRMKSTENEFASFKAVALSRPGVRAAYDALKKEFARLDKLSQDKAIRRK